MSGVSQGKLVASEVHRVAGEIALKSPKPDAEAEAYFERALAVARQQQAKSWELRAAMSIARLWRDRGKRDEARNLLAPVYGWFTEGFDTRDLKDAKALLERRRSFLRHASLAEAFEQNRQLRDWQMAGEPFDREERIEPPRFGQRRLGIGFVAKARLRRRQHRIRNEGTETFIDRARELLSRRVKSLSAKFANPDIHVPKATVRIARA